MTIETLFFIGRTYLCDAIYFYFVSLITQVSRMLWKLSWGSYRSSVMLDLMESDVFVTLLVEADMIALTQYSTNTDIYSDLYEINVCLY